MGKRKGPSKSIFASLPLEIKQSIRSQTSLPLKGDLLAIENQAKSLLPVEGSNFLPTQPSASDDAVSEPTISHLQAGPSKLPATSPQVSDKAMSSSIVTETMEREDVGEYDFTGTDYNDYRPAKKQKVIKGRKKGQKVVNGFKDHPWDCTGLIHRYTRVEQVPVELKKYWYQRHFYFPSYDQLPLLLDTTGWYSITPQPIAAHIAQRCQCDVIVDAFCGVGGNAIEFAKTCQRVIAIDNDPIRLRLSRHNALHLGVADKIEFILTDFISWARCQTLQPNSPNKIDVIFLSPPWGGPDYLTFTDPLTSNPNPQSTSYPLSAILPIPGKELFELCSKITPDIAFYLPRNVDVQEVAQLASREWVEMEEEWVGDKLKAVTAYFGGLISNE
ncbi:hypothetical protein TREMEDRAFT_42923 [Tremella mesenterica DSM 1558]|uniref:uncharacterized protein n=1 Tax=Tremella mesenterica (strain ATCC 24925 / CBS 8224 / DSM 1558 / NBRC 9311 / NRRL Y-6157 / RJB 2259-6 / UBC 559-6) TaxID=578456 RepID=UPI0003F4A45A|nr:uncharacterized protein TREMEDRAFT_42923 [Tremella mesenterica DSM 1558]EIW71555.1 hypothetical protein TREMEDRAFT_42923 [Tremella mesenterica DSM 1558]